MGLAWLALMVSFSMLIAFNVYMAEVIFRLRQDVQAIRRALHIAAPSKPVALPAPAPAPAPAPTAT